MQFSEKTGNLLTALNKSRSEAPSLKRDTDGHKYKYATLEQVINLFCNHFAVNGLSFVQGGAGLDPSVVTVTTRITHIESGEYVETSLTSSPDKFSGPQGVGSTISYLKRYALQGLMGIPTEDDDGKTGSGDSGSPPQKNQKDTLPPPKKEEDPEEVAMRAACREWVDKIKEKHGITVTPPMTVTLTQASGKDATLKNILLYLTDLSTRLDSGTATDKEKSLLNIK